MRSGKFQSCRIAVTGDVKRLGGGYWRLEMRLGRVSGYGNAFGVESGPKRWGGGGYPPPLEAIPWGDTNNCCLLVIVFFFHVGSDDCTKSFFSAPLKTRHPKGWGLGRDAFGRRWRGGGAR